MTKSIYDYIKTCSDDVLHILFEKIIEEINRRKKLKSEDINKW